MDEISDFPEAVVFIAMGIAALSKGSDSLTKFPPTVGSDLGLFGYSKNKPIIKDEHAMKLPKLFLLVFLLFPNPAFADDIFLVGNSLTWDTVPAWLDGNVQWDIYCNRNLDYIYKNAGNSCVGTATDWDDALYNNQYDWVVVQPFTGTTLQQDADIIDEWMSLQPDAQFVIHPGWASHTNYASVYNAGNPDNMMRANPAYIGDLIAELESRNSGRSLVHTGSHEILWSIYQDIEAGVGPFDSLSDLYRDNVHMTYNYGQYMMNNAMRHTLGQSLNQNQNLDPTITYYLDFKVTGVPEPSHIAIICLALPWVVRRRR